MTSFLNMTDERAIEVIRTGIPDLDDALKIGGLPKGQIVEIYGPQGSGKAAIMFKVIASVQSTGGIAALIDAEGIYDTGYTELFGVKTKDLLVSQPVDGSTALDTTEKLVQSGAIDLVVLDSVSALSAENPFSGGMPWKKAMQDLGPSALRTNTVVLFLRCTRESHPSSASYMASICLRTRYDEDTRSTTVRVTKNKYAGIDACDIKTPNPLA